MVLVDIKLQLYLDFIRWVLSIRPREENIVECKMLKC